MHTHTHAHTHVVGTGSVFQVIFLQCEKQRDVSHGAEHGANLLLSDSDGQMGEVCVGPLLQNGVRYVCEGGGHIQMHTHTHRLQNTQTDRQAGRQAGTDRPKKERQMDRQNY